MIRSLRTSPFLLLFITTLGFGCGDDPAAEGPARIVSFESDPVSLEEPGELRLSWVTENATGVTIHQDGAALDLGGAEAAAGSVELWLEASATFELIARGKTGVPASRSLTVPVGEGPAIGSLQAPEVVVQDEDGIARATITWTGVVGADSLRLEADPGETVELPASAMPDGEREVELTVDTTFTLIAEGMGRESRRSVTIHVVDEPLIQRLAADRSRIGPAETVTVEWETARASRIELWVDGTRDDEIDGSETSGSAELVLLFDSEIELRAFNEADLQVSETITVTVGEPLIFAFEATAERIWLGESVELSWDTAGASEFSLAANGVEICSAPTYGAMEASSCEWQPQEAALYQVVLTLENAATSVSESLEVFAQVGAGIFSFVATPDAIDRDDEFVLSWRVGPDPDGGLPSISLRDDRGASYPIDGELEGALTLVGETLGTWTFTLEAETDSPKSQRVEAQAAVEVVAPPEVSLVASSNHFDDSFMGDVVLSWVTTGVQTLTLYRLQDGALVEIASIPAEEIEEGSFHVRPAEETTYRLVGTSPSGTPAEAEQHVTVAPPAILSFVAEPAAVTAGQPLSLSWVTRMGEEVSLDIFDAPYLPEEIEAPFEDIVEQGAVALTLGADCGPLHSRICAFQEFPAGFRFDFGGEERTGIYVFAHGVASFDLGVEFPEEPWVNADLPSSADRWAHLAPFWDELGWDQRRYPGGNIYYLHRSGPEGDSLVFQWHRSSLAADPDAMLSFQLIIREDGDFEYNYGPMLAGETGTGLENGASATIGFQLPDGSASHVRAFNERIGVRGSLSGRTFRYRRPPSLDRIGSFVWHPYSHLETASVTLRLVKGGETLTEQLHIPIARRPEVELIPQVPDPVLLGEELRLAWRSFNAAAIEVVDETGTTRCSAANQEEVREGACSLREEREGRHDYEVLATGDHGFVLRSPISVFFTQPFGIRSFEADHTQIDAGEDVSFTWTVEHAASVELLADGVPVFQDSAPGEEGGFVVTGISANTVFTLRVESPAGLVEEALIDVELWTASLEITPSATRVRPGEPVIVDLVATDLGQGPAPKIFGTLPLIESTDPASAHVDRSEDLVDLEVTPNSSQAMINVDFPEGFTFPFFGEEHEAIRVFMDGYISFELNARTASTNQLLPPPPNLTQAMYREVALAPFWDDLHPRLVGTIHAGPISADAFVVQWSRVSTATGSSNSTPLDLNFQLVLFRDGSFEYRYGEMRHHTPPQSSSACSPNTCMNEVNGSSATIGYQRRDASTGYMLHFGGNSGGIVANQPVAGGLSNRSFRYEPVQGSGTITLTPFVSGSYDYCVPSGGDFLCKSIEIDVDFSLDSFTASKEVVAFGEDVTLSWETAGATQLTIWDGDQVRFTTSDLGTIDQGSTTLSLDKNTEFVLEIEAGIRRATAPVQVKVDRISMTATVPGQIQIGDRVTLSWQLQNHDPDLRPVVIKPMEEDASLRFVDLDLLGDPDADVLIAAEGDNQTVTLGFKNFSFNYLGTQYESLRVSAEGYLSFDLGTPNLTNNVTIPTTNANNRRVHIAPFWDNLRLGDLGQVLGKQVDADRYVIQWSRLGLTPEAASLNFMVVLHRSGDFEFRYGSMVPPESPGDCFPQSCVNEVNGSSATIGYQDPTGTLGHLFHFGGSGRAAGQHSVQGGLSNRTWKFTVESGSGSIQIEPSETQVYRICAIDPAHGDVFCAPAVEVEVPSWGILAFEATPEAPQAGDPLELSWSLREVESLRLLANGVEIGSWAAPSLPLDGSLVHSPTESTTYVLEASSLGRIQSAALQVDLRTFSLTVQGPSGIHMPGDRVELSWSVTDHGDTGTIMVTAPLREIEAGPGQPGAFVDVSKLPGAQLATMSHANGHARILLPPSPFSFPYFGAVYTEVQAFSAGYIALTSPGGFSNALNVPLPAADSVLPIHLAPFWDGLTVRENDEIWTYQPTPDSFVIQWTRFNRTEGSETPAGRYNLNFQVVLFENGAFEYRYGAMEPPAPPYYNPGTCSPGDCEREANGSSATIGYQTIDNSFGYTAHFGGVEKSLELQAATGAGGGAFLAFPGGLSHRSFRFEPGLSGTAEVSVGRTQEHQICAFSSSFAECKSVTVEAVADPGDLMITELMIAPAGGVDHQWFEVRNLSKRPIDLEGFELRAAAGSHVIQGSLVVDPGGYATFAATTGAGIGASYHYGSGMPLGQISDKLELRAGAAIIASVDWGIDWQIPAGRSLSLDPSFHAQGNDYRWNFGEWCDGGAGGNPGTMGVGCKNTAYDVDPSADRPFIDIASMGARLYDAEASGALAQLPGSTFPGSFFGSPIERIWVSANGWISFSKTQPPPTSGVPFLLPRSEADASARTVVGGFWDSLRCDRRAYDCRVHHFQGDIGGQEVTIIQWSGFQHGFGTGSLTFQIQLWADRDIVVAFDEVHSDSPQGSRGYLAYRGTGSWVGIEGWERAAFLTAHHMGDLDFNGRSFHFMAK